MHVRLIGTSWCAPCKVVKKLLEDKGILYEYLDGDTEEGLAAAEACNARGFPVIVIGEDTYVGNTAAQAVREL